jgi:hypothetical protein
MTTKTTAAKATTKTASAKAPKKIRMKLGYELPNKDGSAQAAAALFLRQLPVRKLIPLCKVTGVPVHKLKAPMVAKLAVYFAEQGKVKVEIQS